MEGPLSKWTNVMKGWQYRWFVLDDSAGLLSYYTSKDKMVRGARRGCVRLRNAVVGIDDDDDSTFTITVDAKTFHFQAHDADERETWIRALEDTILRHALAMTKRWDPTRPPPTMADFDKKLTECDAYLQLLIDQSQTLQQQLNGCSDAEDRRKCLQVQAKLNTLLETVKHSIVLLQIAKNTAFPANGVYQPCNAVPSSDSPSPHSARSPYGDGTPVLSAAVSPPGVSSTNDLQGSSTIGPYRGSGKDTAYSEKEESPTQRRLVRTVGYGQQSRSHGLEEDCDSDDPIGLMSEQVRTGIEFGQDAVTATTVRDVPDGAAQSVIGTPTKVPLSVNNIILRCPDSVPETSYSSSEDEDFFDADEFTASAPSGPRLFEENKDASLDDNNSSSVPLLNNATNASNNSYNATTDSSGDVVSTAPSSVALQQHSPATVVSSTGGGGGGVNYDALYEDEEDDDQVSMESHGFIIHHLLSQVKIGMDLTKVVLPTFILERRSLLEMYADFFAHPDLFCSISSGSDPKARIVAVLKWYLSAFHAGRRSDVAKKPYNPIIGEIFRCHWDLPDTKKCSSGAPPVTQPTATPQPANGRPLPWVADDQLSFVAEQVSHHPPISAFYAENVSKRISFCGHIWTKSKFLGLSVCVYNIGQGCVSLLDHDEEYIVNFPSGYCRSILTVPWVELGGSCQITCSKTGYSANVEFLTKPFYGGKKHKVNAEVFSPGEKKPFLSVEGEWNGVMTAKWTKEGKSEVFVDTRTASIVKKLVRPIAQQLPNESRALWKECTAGLKFNNIEAASEAKFALEQKQRDEAKQRKENNESWQTKLFSLQGENWIYHEPLVQRMDGSTS